jgi:alkylated DNA repair protein alkB family protein 6
MTEDGVSPRSPSEPPTLANLGVKIANWQLLSGEEVKNVMEEGGILQRGVRYSLTCRDVERVSSAKSFVRR